MRTTSNSVAMRDSAEQSVLIERAKGGDVRAFEALIEPHVAQVRRFARAFCRDRALAEDLAQDVLLKAYLSIRSYRLQAAFSTWLFRITRNACIDYTRSAAASRGRRTQVLLDEPPETPNQAPDARLERAQLGEQLWKALQSLPVEYRTAVVLFDVEGMTQEEVAAVEGVAIGTVKSRVARGRKRLREQLSRAGLVEPGPGTRGAATTLNPGEAKAHE